MTTPESAVMDDPSSWDPPPMPSAGAGGASATNKDELVLLLTESMRARRRPLPILALWGWQTLLSVMVAWPAAAAVASWYGKHPSGDAPLWQAGGLPLVDLALEAHGVRQETVTLAGIVFLVAGFSDLVPIGALLASIGYVRRDRRAPRMGEVLVRGAGAFPTFASLFAMASMAEGLLVGIAGGMVFYLSESMTAKLGEARADQTALLVALPFLGLAAGVGVMHDLARAAAIRFRVKALRAWSFGFNALARAPVAVLWSWAWRGIAGWIPVGVGALVAARFGGRGGGVLAALFAVHQGVLVVRVAFRASWLAKAMRAVDRAYRVRRGSGSGSGKREQAYR